VVDGALAGRNLFLKFDGSFYVTDVWVNGNYLGQHQGGFAAFVFDATPYLNAGSDNLIAVKVNNASNTNVPPLSADFTFFGGLYRDVRLLATDTIQISPLDFGSPGVYLRTLNVSSNSADLLVTTVVSNAGPSPRAIFVRSVITDTATNVVATLTNAATVAVGSLSNLVGIVTIPSPHLWDGLADPYLYQAFIELWEGTNVLDEIAQPLGFRFFSIDPTNGFSLNGHYLDLHGASMHQDWLNMGWAIGEAQRQTNFSFLKEIGATAMRLSHYEHHDQTYQLADQNGILLWSEIPLINAITESPAFYTNAEQQIRELIRQRYNHPAVICWGLFNEITLGSGPSPTNLISQLAQLAAQEDPTRPSTAAANSSDNDPTTFYSDVIAFNKYYGWYSGSLNNFAPWADTIHSNYPSRRIGVSEFGAGASIYQHSEDPVTEPANAGPFHPEEYQNLFHESHWQQMKSRPFIWCKFVWNMFDFASDGRNEGDTAGRNDKGLVTYDRQIRKDAFYWYKANWTTKPMVYVTGHTFTNRLTNFVTAKVYANCDTVELFLNGISQGSRSSTNRIFNWPITLVRGSNSVQAIGTLGTATVSDSLTWIGPTAPPVAAITSPSGPIVFLNSTNDSLLLSASASDPQQNPPGFLIAAWHQLNGPGVAVFGDTNSLSTTARFTADGIYGVAFTANNGAATTLNLTVVVNPGSDVTNGLLAWWKMDEFVGSVASDSSGNGRNASVSGANFTSGYLSNALHFNGASNVASFASPDSGQVTVSAWVRADAHGNSAFPRIIETPGYRVFFRFDASGSNGFDFATFTPTQNGDWFSGQNTVSTGAWVHVAASYDRASLTNLPALYVNGIRRTPGIITSPAGAQPSSAGTGYIGNRAAEDRAWNGLIDDLRIYNRLLADAEVMALASRPPANLAPVVYAGANQTIVIPAPANLIGSASDDGKPNPPGSLSVAWTEVSGPGGVAFTSTNALATSASFTNDGNYILRMVADDGQVRVASDLTITAIARPILSAQLISNSLKLSWQSSVGNWQLQTQTNPVYSGLGTNWMDFPGVTTNPFVIPINPAAGPVFHRLILR
jgi:beta-galactosidase